ncbi:Juvenile hormone esterase [Portunus trituberculatus]|uniref:Juvenile hormone esterase n=1 Tax=Portunus trituberculatus TaxID=210409 RepID=A0A5B7DV94_PORTR|nr:Juvenile hormone esterase [Portunus trituberculatus]
MNVSSLFSPSQRPFPYGPYHQPFNATGESPPCLQWDTLRGRGSVGQEDCLYLNVYTNTPPCLPRQIPQPPHYYNTQPVIVLLHAGTWLAGGGGDGLFQPDYMIESDVTVVTLNHRLGPFVSQSREGAQGTSDIARLRLGHTTLSAHLHRLRLSHDPFCPWCRTTPEDMEHFLLHILAHASTLNTRTALRSWLSALAITTLDLPTLLGVSGVHPSWQPAVLHLTCAFLRKTGQIPLL